MMAHLPRAISRDEATVVGWMLAHASVIGPLDHLLQTVPDLRVVGTCGCASVDFVVGGQASPYKPIAGATGLTARGQEVELILFGTTDVVAGLEIVGHYPQTIGL